MSSPETTRPKVPADFPIPDEWKSSPRATLGGQEWAIAPMSGRNIAKFSSHAIKMRHGIGRMIPGGDTSKIEDDEVEKNVENIFRGVHFGLLRAYPTLTFDDFYDMAIDTNELDAAFPIVAKAAGMDVKRVAPGEAQAAPTPSSNSSTSGTIS